MFRKIDYYENSFHLYLFQSERTKRVILYKENFKLKFFDDEIDKFIFSYLFLKRIFE